MPRALITGASRGIGRAVALRLAQDYEVIATGRATDHLDSLRREIEEAGGSCNTLALDLRNPAEIARALDGLDVDVLVNNAGVMHKRPTAELSAEEWNEMVAVNLNALFHTTKAVLPAMFRRGSGHIVNIASITGRTAFAGGAGYSATKHAVMGFSESLMLEVRDRGVRVSVVLPGSVATGLIPPGTDTSWMLTPEDVAEAIADILSMPSHALVFQVEVRASRPRKKT